MSHECQFPGDALHRTLGWECGFCGRFYTPTQYGWVETRGPTVDYTDPPEKGETDG